MRRNPVGPVQDVRHLPDMLLLLVLRDGAACREREHTDSSSG
jgi:hypothetical protein